MKTLSLKTNVGELSANLYMPEGTNKPLPLVIVTGAWTTVKEQMPATYAEALSKKGYAALTFDFRGWGQSIDAIKYLEDPERKTEDIRAVIDALVALDGIDSDRIYGLGICASAGYMLDAASHNPRIKSVAVVAPWLHNLELATQIYGGEESITGLLKAGDEALASPDLVAIEAASSTNEQSLMYQAPYYTEVERGMIPEYDNLFNVASWKGWLTYDSVSKAKDQDKPVMMIASEAMALPAGAKLYLESSAENVEAKWLDGITQFEFYDVPEIVDQATDIALEHYAGH